MKRRMFDCLKSVIFSNREGITDFFLFEISIYSDKL